MMSRKFLALALVGCAVSLAACNEASAQLCRRGCHRGFAPQCDSCCTPQCAKCPAPCGTCAGCAQDSCCPQMQRLTIDPYAACLACCINRYCGSRDHLDQCQAQCAYLYGEDRGTGPGFPTCCQSCGGMRSCYSVTNCPTAPCCPPSQPRCRLFRRR